MVAIINYNAGNIASVQNALQRLGCDSIITHQKDEILAADKVIFPGVGEASSTMSYLRKIGLDQTILAIQKPFLGICLGMQLMCQYSEEGDTTCLGIFDAKVQKFPPEERVPHIGWNNFDKAKGALFENIKIKEDVYFVHSYYANISPDTSAICDYILPFSAAMQRANFYATQFHPEKSASVGEQILKNFLSI